MPPSRSASRSSRPARLVAAALAVAALLVVAVAVMPASLVRHWLPPVVQASDFSGGLWHGAAGHLVVSGKDGGAVEWRLHPAELLRLRLGADLTWAKGSFSLHGDVMLAAGRLTATAVRGGGAIEDIATLTGMADWRGTSAVRIDRLEAGPGGLESLAGEVTVSDLRSPRFSDGEDLGGYRLRIAPPPDGHGAITGQVVDTGDGPLQVTGNLTADPSQRAGTLTSLVQARPSAPGPLRQAIEQLAMMRPRDRAGNVPLDIEFSW